MAVTNGSQDTLYFVVLFLVLSVILLAFAIRHFYLGWRHVFLKALLAQNIATVAYFCARLALVINRGDTTCGALTLFSGVIMWYICLGIFYAIQSQKARALCQNLFPQVNKLAFIAMQVVVILIWGIHVIVVAARTYIQSCTVVYEGLAADFACAIVIETYLLIQNIVVLVNLNRDLADVNPRWSTMQLDLLKKSALMMIYLISSNIYVYNIYIPTVAYIIWYSQIFLWCYLSYSTLQNIHATNELVVLDLSAGLKIEYHSGDATQHEVTNMPKPETPDTVEQIVIHT
ncbi:hypothetical protein SpCBS45565_g06467 [Spizellomyces sp. 'palustris']|nr:hypothetical protein SpCBS45565_g06467 [Spizellomyces sp. 'palustris']